MLINVAIKLMKKNKGRNKRTMSNICDHYSNTNLTDLIFLITKYIHTFVSQKNAQFPQMMVN